MVKQAPLGGDGIPGEGGRGFILHTSQWEACALESPRPSAPPPPTSAHPSVGPAAPPPPDSHSCCGPTDGAVWAELPVPAGVLPASLGASVPEARGPPHSRSGGPRSAARGPRGPYPCSPVRSGLAALCEGTRAAEAPSPPLLAGAPGTREPPPQAPGAGEGRAQRGWGAAGVHFPAAGARSCRLSRAAVATRGSRWPVWRPALRAPAPPESGRRGRARSGAPHVGRSGRRGDPGAGGSEGGPGSALRSAPPRAGARLTPETLPLALPPLCSPALPAESRFPVPPPGLSPGF